MNIQKNVRIADLLWYKIGGTVAYLLEAKNREDVLFALDFIEKNNIKKHFVVGLGSNLLFTDSFYDGAVVRIVQENGSDIQERTDEVVEVFAGKMLDEVIKYSFDKGLTGLEWAGGLPGTVGAAIRGNVGAFGGEIKDIFHHAEIVKIEPDGRFNTHTVNRRDIKFAYRASTIKTHRNLIVLSSAFQLKKGDLGRARQTYFGNIEYRNNRHPMDLPNTGSAFKNIKDPEDVKKVLEVFPDIEQKVAVDWHGKVSMGYLNKRLELSGLRIGNAQISQKHSNFIVNLGGATFSDVFTIIKSVQERFEDTFGFTPEPEVEIVE